MQSTRIVQYVRDGDTIGVLNLQKQVVQHHPGFRFLITQIRMNHREIAIPQVTAIRDLQITHKKRQRCLVEAVVGQIRPLGRDTLPCVRALQNGGRHEVADRRT